MPGTPPVIFPSTIVTVVSAFCAPFVLSSGCGFGDTINNFILIGESTTRINDLNTGCAANNYDNRISQSVTLFVNMVYTAYIGTQYSSGEYYGIWIDFDDDSVFEASERVSSGLLTSTSNTAISVTIPTVGGGAVVGVHRMRVAILWNVPANPCGPPANYGEIHDYSVNIIAYSSKFKILLNKTKRKDSFDEILFLEF